MLRNIVSLKRGSKSSESAMENSSVHSVETIDSVDLMQWARQLEESVQVQDRTYHFRIYKNCFVGKEAVDFLVKSGLATNRLHAVELGREFARRLNLLEHVCRDHEFKDEELFYRFVPKHQRFISINDDLIEDGDDYSISSSETDASMTGAMGIRDVEDAFVRIVDVRDRRHHFQVYPGCFIGSDAVTQLVSSGYARSREQAVRLGQRLKEERGLFRHVVNDDHTFKDEYLFYQFIPKEERIIVNPGEKLSLQEIADRFHRGIKVKNRCYRAKTYKDVFIGSKAVDWLIRYHLANSRQEAVEIGRALMNQLNLFRHVNDDHSFHDDYLFYRFTPVKEWKSLELQLSDTESMDTELKELADLFRRGVKVQNNRYRGKKYRKTFVGSQAVDFLVNSNQAKTRRQAVEIGRRLASELDLFDHVTGDHLFKDDFLFYRFNDESLRRWTGLSQISGLSDISSSSFSLEKIAEIFQKGVDVQDRRFHLRLYKNCFVGSEAVDFLVGSNLAESRTEAVDIGRSLAREYSLFEHVTKDHEFKDAYLFYRMKNTEICSTAGVTMDSSRLFELAQLFEAGIEVKDHRHRMRVFHNSFVGKEAVDFMVESGMAESRYDAVQLGRAFAKQFNMMEHVTHDHLFSDDELYFRFLNKEQRYSWETKESMHGIEIPELEVYSDDEQWVKRVKAFETKILMKWQKISNECRSEYLSFSESNMEFGAANRLKCWAGELRRLDPRYQIFAFFNDVAQVGANNIEAIGLNPTVTRPLLRYFPRSSVFTVWRPTSFDAIRAMMLGQAVGKGLDIKGKSAKRGKLKAYVPFLQISDNKHKRKIRALPKHGTVRLFFKSDARRARDIVAEKLEEVAMEMKEIVKGARRILADGKADDQSHQDALESMLLEMHDPSISYIDVYAPHCYGLDIPVRLLWEAFFVRQDCTRIPGSEYDIGRPSQPAFQDMNFATLRSRPKDGDAPRVVLIQNADPDFPMNPFEILMAYEQNGQVLPVVSDFDCFLVGTRGIRYSSPLPPCQLSTLKRCVSRIECILDSHSKEPKDCSWTSRWLDALKRDQDAGQGACPRTPIFGFGDPKSYSIMKHAVHRLKMIGAVRHGSESFNYSFPQELDEEFLIVSDDLPGNMPWTYVDLEGLQSFLSAKIDEGFTFPLHVKWILCDEKWKELYDKLMASDIKNVQDSMEIWFPRDSGIREKIEEIHKRHPHGFGKSHFYQDSLRQSGLMALASLALNSSDLGDKLENGIHPSFNCNS
jgi:hypothetical protein